MRAPMPTVSGNALSSRCKRCSDKRHRLPSAIEEGTFVIAQANASMSDKGKLQGENGFLSSLE